MVLDITLTGWSLPLFCKQSCKYCYNSFKRAMSRLLRVPRRETEGRCKRKRFMVDVWAEASEISQILPEVEVEEGCFQQRGKHWWRTLKDHRNAQEFSKRHPMVNFRSSKHLGTHDPVLFWSSTGLTTHYGYCQLICLSVTGKVP